MATYEYKCSKCDIELTIQHKITDRALMYCDVCKQDTLERLISSSSFRLKGGGWYETDVKGQWVGD